MLAIVSIPGAEKIEIVKFNNAQFIHRKNAFSEGDVCLVLKSNIFVPESRRRMLKIPRGTLSPRGTVQSLSFLGERSNCYALALEPLLYRHEPGESAFIDYLMLMSKNISDNWIDYVSVTEFERFGFKYLNPLSFLIPKGIFTFNNANKKI